MLVRIVDMNDVDIAKIQFDYDLVFAVVFMNAHGTVYGRYGGRTPWNAESRVSLAGLKYTMRRVLGAHHSERRPPTPAAEPLLARELFPSKRSCMHCHEVWEGLRNRARRNGDFDPRSLFVYPRPENIGLTLQLDAGNRVLSVKENSASAQAGLRAGDEINQIGYHAIFSQADVSWALHQAPETGKVPIRFTRGVATKRATIRLKQRWKETTLTWRASMRKENVPQSQRGKRE